MGGNNETAATNQGTNSTQGYRGKFYNKAVQDHNEETHCKSKVKDAAADIKHKRDRKEAIYPESTGKDAATNMN